MTSSTASRPTARYYGLEWLRFLMALYMVVYHLGGLYSDLPDAFRRLAGMGFFATSTFFLLSGFLLAHVSLDRQGALKGSSRGFVLRRLCNLYPIHLLTLLVALGLSYWLSQDSWLEHGVPVYYNQHPYLQLDEGSQLDEMLPLSWLAATTHVLLQLLLLQSWEPRFLWLNGAAWSISALLFFYLLFPLLGPRLMRLRRWALATAVLWGLYLLGPLVATWAQAFDTVTVGVIHRNPLIRLPEFLLGILLYRAVQEPWVAETTQRLRVPLLLFGLTGLWLGALLLEGDGRRWFYLVHNGLLTPFQAAVLLACATFGEPGRAGVRRLAQRLGEASLCIFAVHTPLIGVLEPWTRTLLGWMHLAGDSLEDLAEDVGEALALPIPIPGWMLPLHLVLIVLLGLAMQRWVAGPLRRWLQARLPQS